MCLFVKSSIFPSVKGSWFWGNNKILLEIKMGKNIRSFGEAVVKNIGSV